MKARWALHEVVDNSREGDTRCIGPSANVRSYSVEHRAVVHLSDFLQLGALLKKVLTIAEALSLRPLADLATNRSLNDFEGRGDGQDILKPDTQGVEFGQQTGVRSVGDTGKVESVQKAILVVAGFDETERAS